jgi:hypothetical protein
MALRLNLVELNVKSHVNEAGDTDPSVVDLSNAPG